MKTILRLTIVALVGMIILPIALIIHEDKQAIQILKKLNKYIKNGDY